MKKISLVTVTLLFFFCIRQQTKVEPSIIPAAFERLYLAPIISDAELEHIEGWPEDAATKQALVKNITEIRQKLKEEFVKYEKYGYYEMVDDTSNYPTMRISVTLMKATLHNDTLRMPVNLQVERIPDGQNFVFSMPAFSTAPKSGNSDNYLGILLLNYKRKFPYKELVSFFYPNQQNHN